MIGVVTLQRKSVMCLLLLVIAVLMLSGCHQQSRSAQLDIAVQQPPGVEQPTEAQPTPQARPAKPEQAEDPSFLSPESDGDYDLVFFFATADIGDYEFSIAPEGSDDAASQRSTAGCISSPRIFQSSDSASRMKQTDAISSGLRRSG